MEPNRYHLNKKQYIIGMISLLVGLSFILFSLYILPHLLFGWVYDVPDFIASIREYLMTTIGSGYRSASFYIFIFFLFFGLIFSYISAKISNQIDDEIHQPLKNNTAKPKIKVKFKLSAMSFFLKMLLLIVTVYFLILVMESLLTSTIPLYRGTL